MRVRGIGWAGLLTEDFEATLHFFAEVMGLSLAHRDEAKVIAHFRLPSGQLLEIYGPTNRQRKEKYRWFDGPALGFEVEAVGPARQAMLGQGARFITEVQVWEDEAWSMFLGPEDRLFEILRLTRRYPKRPAQIRGFSWSGIVMQDVAGAARFFSQIMAMPLTRRDGSPEQARFELPAGHVFEVFGPNTTWGQLTSHAMLGFEVEDVWQVRRALEAKEVSFIGEVSATSTDEAATCFRGPDGYLYRLIRVISARDMNKREEKEYERVQAEENDAQDTEV